MKRIRRILSFVSVGLVFSPLNLGATEYLIVNGNNANSNSAIIYKLNPRTGHLTKTAVLKTDGQAFANPPNLFQVQQAVGPEAGCMFVLDTGSSDIAAFSRASGYKRVGRYFDANLIDGGYGGSISLTPDGRFLYAVYEETGNIGAWAVNSDCTLTLVAIYQENYANGPLRVAPNGKYLLASSEGGDGALLYAVSQNDGTLTSLGHVGFNMGVCARETFGCSTYGADITKDSEFAVLASEASNITRQYGIPVALTARITPSGFTNPHAWVLTHSKGWETNIFPFLGAQGYAGSGDVYFSMWGAGNGLGPGVLTVTFTERPMSFKLRNATTIDEQGEGLFSLSIFPDTR